MSLCYTGSIPIYEGPDEYAHLQYIAYLLRERKLPPLDAATAHISHQLVQQPPLFYALSALAVAGLPVDEALAHAEINPYVSKNLSHRAYLTLPETPATSTYAPRVARLVSMLGALMAVWGTWLLARRLFPQAPWLAFVAAALVGFNPQFLFSAATITNDTWAAALSVWALWLALGADQSSHPWRVWLGVGMLLGAALLVKYSALAVAAPIAIVALVQIHRHGWRDGRYALQNGVAAISGFGLVAGWWLLRNMMLVGQPIPFAHMVALQPQMAWPQERAWGDPALWQSVRWLLRSYWGVFGYGIIAPASYHGIIQSMLLVALLGYGVWALRALFDRNSRHIFPLLLAGSWFVVAFAGLLNWMRVMQFSDQGRLLFPAAAAISLLILMGWAAWLPRHWTLGHWTLGRWTPLPLTLGLAVGATALMVWLGFSQIETLHAYYAMPPALNAPLAYDRPIEARFEAGMTLLGVDFPQGAALQAGGALPITLYWTTDRTIPINYTLFIHLADSQDRLLYQFDGVPYNGRHPTRQWISSQLFADSYVVTFPKSRLAGDTEGNTEGEKAELATLSLGFYPYDATSKRQVATSLTTGAVLGDRIPLAKVRVYPERSAEQGNLTDAPLARWQQGIELAEASITPNADPKAQGAPQQVTLRWQVSEVVQENYTLFLQLLDAQNQVIAQVDRQPLEGAWPTSTWQQGDVIEETIELPTPTGAWSQLILGLYDQNGVRLPLVAPQPALTTQEYFTLQRAE